MKYIAILVVILVLVYFYKSSQSVKAVSNPNGSSTSGSSTGGGNYPGNPSYTDGAAPTITRDALPPVRSGPVSPTDVNMGQKTYADSSVYNTSQMTGYAPAIGAGATNLGLSSNGYNTYLGANGTIYGFKNGQMVSSNGTGAKIAAGLGQFKTFGA
jgi:hypothetical protein